jgi:hypothetical protein
MPILPLDHPEPFAATLGVMVYPGTDGDDPLKARAFAADWLVEPIRRLHEDGHKMSYEALLRILTDGGQLEDLHDRWWGGRVTGELVKALWALFKTDPALTSWNNAVKIYELTATRDGTPGSRSALWDARSRFLSVAHLWGAWSIREGKFGTRPDVGYDGFDDFQSFLTEAEILRMWGQRWLPPRTNSKPLLSTDIWQVPENWEPPKRHPGWPPTGQLPVLTLAEELLTGLKKAGRPRKAG